MLGMLKPTSRASLHDLSPRHGGVGMKYHWQLAMKFPSPAFDLAQSVTALVLLAAILAFALLALLAPPAQAARGSCLTKAASAAPGH